MSDTPQPINYDKVIADAAREFRAARRANNLHRSREAVERLAVADERLCWLIDAAEFGWDPANYQRET